ELDVGDHHTFSPAKPDEIAQRLVRSELVDAVLSTTVMGTLLRVRDNGAVSRFMSSPDRAAQRELSPLGLIPSVSSGCRGRPCRSRARCAGRGPPSRPCSRWSRPGPVSV